MEALLIIDIQNDFLPGGSLAVPEGDCVVPVINRLMPFFPLVVATRDWHPSSHKSFAAAHPGRQVGEVIQLNGLDQLLWPVHCVQDSYGAELAPHLSRTSINRVIFKGANPEIDSYSGFFDNGRRQGTGLHEYLQEMGVTCLYVAGLATDYCVKFTVEDACSLGYETWLVRDASRAVNLAEGDEERAIEQMVRAGAKITTSLEMTMSMASDVVA